MTFLRKRDFDMRRIFVTIVAALALGSPMWAGDKVVEVVMQILPDGTDVLPEKTLEMKLPCYEVKETAPRTLGRAVTELADSVIANDYYNKVFTLTLERGADGSVGLMVVQCDPFLVENAQYKGVIQHRYMTFLLVDSQELLAVKKAGKARLERVFEVTEDIMATLPTTVSARWSSAAGLTVESAEYNVIPEPVSSDGSD